MELKELENPEKLREFLQNGTLSLRDLDKKKRGSSGGRRRRSKSKKGGNVTTDDTTKTQAVDKHQNLPMAPKINRPSKPESSSKNAEKGLKWKTHEKESIMVVRSILDGLLYQVSKDCSAVDYSDAQEISAPIPALLGACDEGIVAIRNFYTEQRRTTLELLYEAAQENVEDLIKRATTRHYDFPSLFSSNEGQLVTTTPLRFANDGAQQRVYHQLLHTEKMKIKTIKNMGALEIEQYFRTFSATRAKIAEKRIMAVKEFYENEQKMTQKLLYKAAKQTVNDLIIQATPNCDFAGSIKTEVDISALVRSEEYTTRLKAVIEKTNAEKLAIQKILYNTASGVVEDLFDSGANNA
ncbi:uncharacterized protein LOC134247124, partial [Saccostrea cucullata]|uniref:uncharacterized protein LOC134247124 n=1 Tax=Saccostrea cuccullata TaxID=36930 RepID=UPI002ED2CA0A